MDRVGKMQASTQAYSVKFLEMTRIYGKSRDIIACVFEGEDSKYYAPRLNYAIGEGSWHGINSGGKKIVLQVYDCIAAHPIYSLYRYAFFIDSDYDHWSDYSDKKFIYQTASYSIENYYTTENSLKNIISSEFNISECGDEASDFEKIINKYVDLLEIFCYALSEFNYFAKAHRIMERENKSIQSLNLSNVKLSDLVKVELDGINIIYDLENPSSVFKDSKDFVFAARAISEARETLPKEKWATHFRGKQQLEFLRQWLSLLKADRCAKVPKFFSKSGNVKISLSRENCISELSQYASTPACLRDFIDMIKNIPEPQLAA